MSVLALCPTRGRPAAAHSALASFLATRGDPASRIVFVVDRDDPTAPDYPVGFTRRVKPTGCMGMAMRAALVPDVLRDATVVGMIGDDNRFVTHGWDVAIMAALATRPGIAYGDDGFQHERLPTAWWLSRVVVDEFGMTNPNLRHLYMDNYWLELGRALDVITYLPDVSIEHLHPLAGKAENDETYVRSSRFVRHDRTVHETWSRGRGKARDVARLRRVLGMTRVIAPPDSVNVLADWHHPALWESLELLCGRLGWNIFSPYGLEWRQHGWTFENGTPGWGADRYLSPPGAYQVDDRWEVVPREYPTRPRRMVTWDQAQSIRWSYVLSSVVQHQRSWAGLARRFGARPVHQVGNAKHMIDRAVRQTIIASARGVRNAAVMYHQEFDLDVFAPRPIVDPFAVSSFMLRIDRSSCDHTWLSADPRFRWSSYGAATPDADDYLSPMTVVAERMAEAGWVWHDKMIGDGYGHVMWNAAAIGRPLIGHASHFKGAIAEPLWADLRTCVDLDVHPPDIAAKLIAAVSRDPDWHAEMAMAIRDRFVAEVDFAAEAEAIRRALS